MRREKLFSILVLGFLILLCKKIIIYKQRYEFEFESECVCKQDKKIILTKKFNLIINISHNKISLIHKTISIF